MADSRVEAASEEFALAELGDARLTRRLMTIADSVAASPEVGFPRLVSGDGELEGVYRFLGNERHAQGDPGATLRGDARASRRRRRARRT